MDSNTETPSPARTRPARTTQFSGGGGREDCWSEEATFTLVEAWGDRYLALKRGNLRQKHWQEVADAVNSDHCDGLRSRRTDIQCKNRIDTLKKKYKIEKARVYESDGAYVSPWPFFGRLDALIGKNYPISKVLSPPETAVNRDPSPPSWARYSPVPVGPRSATQKRPATAPAPVQLGGDHKGSQRNFSEFAAAAVAAFAEEAEEEEDEDTDRSGSRSSSGSGRRNRETEPLYRGLAQAIERFGEIYERVEVAKQRQMVELEKQRMQFAKDLEFQRMQLFMETQVQLQKIKRAKRSSGNDSYS